jgi:lysyl-tRNA synthetase class 2
LQLPEYPSDEKLLAALASGLPACAGVALGVDRLLMLKVGATDISEVISFTDA